MSDLNKTERRQLIRDIKELAQQAVDVWNTLTPTERRKGLIRYHKILRKMEEKGEVK